MPELFDKSTRLFHFVLAFSLTVVFWAPSLVAQQILFEENKGQWPAEVYYSAEVHQGRLFIGAEGLTWNFAELPHRHDLIKDREMLSQQIIKGHAYRARPLGKISDRAEVELHGKSPAEGYVNYLRGKDPSKWASYVKRYEEVLLKEYLPGVDLRFSGQRGLKYDLIVKPAAEADEIRFEYQGQDGLKLENGALLIETQLGTITEDAPKAWQYIEGQIVDVPCQYKLRKSELSFTFPQGYDKRYELIIDPAVHIFGSYSGSTSDNWGYTATYDSDGSLFGGGIVFGTGYPTTLGAYQENFAGGTGTLGCDVGITKFSDDGTVALWATYLGGSGNDLPFSMVANDSADLWIYGATSSADFPITPGAYDSIFDGGATVTITAIQLNGTDIFVSKLAADGASLIGSTYFGGTSNDGLNNNANTQFNYGDHARGEIILTENDEAIIASSTLSDDLPVTAGVFQSANNGLQDGCLFQLDSDCSNLLHCSYLGGIGNDGAFSLALGPAGEIYVSGGTASPDFATTLGAYQEIYGGNVDGYVVEVTPDWTALNNSTFVGTVDYDQAYFIKLDRFNDVYITGQSQGAFPVSPGVFSNPGAGQFVARFDPDLQTLEVSTVFGNAGVPVNMSPTAFLVDVCGNVYISGWGGVTNTVGNVNGMPLTADAFQDLTDGSDFYFIVFEQDLIGLEYATYYGGGISNEHVDGGTSRFDENGVIYQAVCAGCGSFDDFPTTPGAVSNTNNSANCNLGVAKFELDFSGVNAEAVALPALIGCVPFTVDFINSSSPGADYFWDFGDGVGSSTDFEPTYTYSAIGSYSVELIVIDSTTCNISDTAYLSVIVHEDSVFASFTAVETDFCDSLVVVFTNTSDSVGDVSYNWDFGDGTSTTDASPTHTYVLPGDYVVQLIASDPVSCNLADTVTTIVSVLPRAIASYDGSAAGCAPLTPVLANTSIGVSPSYSWDFGDGTTSTATNPSHTYSSPGEYTVVLIVTDPGSCNGADTLITVVTVFADPLAGFDADPEVGSIYQTVNFTDLSVDAASWTWDFGDGAGANIQNPEHMYSLPGEYEVCLFVETAEGCEDSICSTIRLDAESDMVFPNAFSPNGDDKNDFFLPINFGLENYLLQIFNRWGELIFETTDPTAGWDGTYKGKEQEIGTYVYVGYGDGLDGVRYVNKGNFSLLR